MQPGDRSSDETTSVSLSYEWTPNAVDERDDLDTGEKHDDQITSTWLPSHGGAPRRRPTFSNREAMSDPSTWADVEAATRRLEAQHAASTLRALGTFQMDWDEDESTTHAHRPPQYAHGADAEIERPASVPPPLPSRRATPSHVAPARTWQSEAPRLRESRPVARPAATVVPTRQAQRTTASPLPASAPVKQAARTTSRQAPSAELRRERATVPQPTAAAFAREAEANETARAISQQLKQAEAQNERLGEQIVDLLERLKLSEARMTEAGEEIVSLIDRLRAGDARANESDQQLYAMFERSNETEARATRAEQQLMQLSAERNALPLRESDLELAPPRTSIARRWPLWLALAFVVGCAGSLYFASYLPLRQRLASEMAQAKLHSDEIIAQRTSWGRERTDLLSQLMAAKTALATAQAAPPPVPAPLAKVPSWKSVDHGDSDAQAAEREDRENREAERDARAAEHAARAAERATKKAEREAKLEAEAAAKRDGASGDDSANGDAAGDAADKPAKPKHAWSSRARHRDADVKANAGAEGAAPDDSAGEGASAPAPKREHSDTGSEKVSDDPLDGLD
ncbi:MAG TPA: hypothetical protein VGI70_19490 [Polyangiales bacterium]